MILGIGVFFALWEDIGCHYLRDLNKSVILVLLFKYGRRTAMSLANANRLEN
jgi:hypothetical protein